MNIINKFCPRCKLNKNISDFGTHKLHGIIKPNTYCCICLPEIGKEKWLKKKKNENTKDRKEMTIFDVKEICGEKKARCISCREYKLLDLFSKNKSLQYGISKYCKVCKKIKDKNNYLKHQHENKLKRKEYYQKNKQKRQIYYANKRKTDLNFKINEKIKNKIYREKNKEILKIKKREYYLKNKKILNKKAVEKKNLNINLRLKQNLRSRIWHALKHGNKKENFKELIGCSVEELKLYIEKQFKNGMNWNNYGSEWHLDHIKPCVLFDMTVKEQRLQCFNYKNLQPLWKLENMIKNRFYT